LKSHEDRRKLQESNDIVIIHVNDVHCGLNDTIGYDGFALYRDELKKNYPNLLTVDAGDHVQGGH
jgi:2',3'-cyclic-nucleotide 2'-phosphodiesterase (5'-nucleotidase family)